MTGPSGPSRQHKELIRGADFLIRWGREFLVILPEMDEELPRNVSTAAGKLEEVRQSPRLKDRAYHVSSPPRSGRPVLARVPLEKAIEKADSVMYERKKAPRKWNSGVSIHEHHD